MDAAQHWLTRLLSRLEGSSGLTGPEDTEALHAFIAALTETFAQHGVAFTPLVLWRAEEALVSWLTARRIEDVLWAEGVYQIEAKKRAKTASPEAEPEPMTRSVHAAVEAAGKARERMRRAMKELEETCEKLGAPIDQGLADILKPVVQKGDGVLDDAVHYEDKRQKRAKARKGSAG